MLHQERGSAFIITSEETGEAYKITNFSRWILKLRKEANKERKGLLDLTFQDLRDTAITNLARAGSTIPEIAAVSGHSEQSILGILKHYLALNSDMAGNAINKLMQHQQGG